MFVFGYGYTLRGDVGLYIGYNIAADAIYDDIALAGTLPRLSRRFVCHWKHKATVGDRFCQMVASNMHITLTYFKLCMMFVDFAFVKVYQ